MNDDYLWDGSGEPDPEVQRLEGLLSRFRRKPGAGDPVASEAEEASETRAGVADASERGDAVETTERSTPRLVVSGASPASDRHGEDAQGAPVRSTRATAASDSTSGFSSEAGWSRISQPERGATRARRRAAVFVGAIAAAIVLTASGIALLRSGRLGVSGAGGWDVVALAGEPRLASRPMAASGTGTLLPGEWIETDESARAEILIGRIGKAEIEPRTRVRLLQAGTTQHRLGLARGTIHARIWAPPRLFFIETPSAVAVDLGCAYTLTVDDDGGSRLRVESGWVAFEDEGAESFVPAGAICRTAPGGPPGTPYFEDAPPAFIEALARIDAERVSSGLDTGSRDDRRSSGTSGADTPRGVQDPGRSCRESIGELLDAARPQDALTLWHLLARTEDNDRALLFDRMAQLVPPPAGVTRAGVLAGDRTMADLWWDELGLGVTSWWRLWKQPGPPKLE